jgi:2-hydroxyacyl-CoA lyase 1
MELETATRYNLPIVVIIINNNGIFMGVDEIAPDSKRQELPVTALNPDTRYELLVFKEINIIKKGEALGAKGILVNTHAELHIAMKDVLANKHKSYVINVKISPHG